MEVRDLWPESIVAVGALQNRTIISFLESLELKCYTSAIEIVSVTDSFKRAIVSKGIHQKKISVVKNGSNNDLFFPMAKQEGILQREGLSGKFVVAYIGTLGMAHGLDFIVESAKYIDDNDIQIVLMGDGSRKENLKKKIEVDQIDNVSLWDSVSKGEIRQYIASIDVALINLKKSPLFKTVIPSKIFENAAMEKPILLGVDGESRQIIEDYSAGLFFEPENRIDFLEKLYLLKTNYDLYKKCRIGCRNLSRDFDRKILAAQMLSKIKFVFAVN